MQFCLPFQVYLGISPGCVRLCISPLDVWDCASLPWMCEMRAAQGQADAASRGHPCISSLHHARGIDFFNNDSWAVKGGGGNSLTYFFYKQENWQGGRKQGRWSTTRLVNVIHNKGGNRQRGRCVDFSSLVSLQAAVTSTPLLQAASEFSHTYDHALNFSARSSYHRYSIFMTSTLPICYAW